MFKSDLQSNGSPFFVFCINCGEENNIGARFCQNCGTFLGATDRSKKTEKVCNEDRQSMYSERKQEFAGKIIKCPSCGTELPGFTAICPDCGHEINAQRISSSLREFIDSINECDRIIANNPDSPETGWKGWGKGKKVLWIVLNAITFCIPFVIYMTFPMISPFLLPKSIPKLSVDEKRKTSLIENYVFPNEREALIEAMMFIKSKMAFLASQRQSKKTLYWLNLWNTKAEQLNQRAGIILKDDKIVKSVYTDIVATRNRVNRGVKWRAAAGAFIIIVFGTFVFIKRPDFRGTTKIMSDTDDIIQISDDNGFEWLETGLSTQIPKISAEEGSIYTNNDTELSIRLEGISYNEFESYVTACKELGYTVDAVKDTYTYTAYNEEGYLLEVSCYTDDLGVELKAPQTGIADYKWPENDLAQRIPEMEADSGSTEAEESEKCEIFLYGISQEDYVAYIKLCENAGFTIDCERSEQTYCGFDSEGYKLSVSLNELRRMDIVVESPMTMVKINWSAVVGVAEALPKPKSKTGKIVSNYDSSFTAYIGNTTIDEYNKYVDRCIKKGFNIKNYRTDTYFSAEDKKGDDLTVEYVGYNTIRIRIYNYDRN